VTFGFLVGNPRYDQDNGIIAPHVDVLIGRERTSRRWRWPHSMLCCLRAAMGSLGRPPRAAGVHCCGRTPNAEAYATPFDTVAGVGPRRSFCHGSAARCAPRGSTAIGRGRRNLPVINSADPARTGLVFVGTPTLSFAIGATLTGLIFTLQDREG
jgi:hypothetical protein